MGKERQGLFRQPEPPSRGNIFALLSMGEAETEEVLRIKGDIDPQEQSTQKNESPEPPDPLKPKVVLQQRFLQLTNGAVNKNHEEPRKTPEERKEIRQKQIRKYGRHKEVIHAEISQILSPDSDPESSPPTHVPPEDTQILTGLTQPEIDLSQGAKIPLGLPLNSLERYAAIIKSTTNNSEIAKILIEEQIRETRSGPGPSKLEIFSLNTLHRWMAPGDEVDYGPEH